jgi:hypothetical protein
MPIRRWVITDQVWQSRLHVINHPPWRKVSVGHIAKIQNVFAPIPPIQGGKVFKFLARLIHRHNYILWLRILRGGMEIAVIK